MEKNRELTSQQRKEFIDKNHFGVFTIKNQRFIYKNESIKHIFGESFDNDFINLRYCKKNVTSKLENTIYDDIIELKGRREFELINMGITLYKNQKKSTIYFFQVYALYFKERRLQLGILQNITSRYKQCKPFPKIKTKNQQLQSPENSSLLKRRINQNSSKSDFSISPTTSESNSSNSGFRLSSNNRTLSLGTSQAFSIINNLKRIQSIAENATDILDQSDLSLHFKDNTYKELKYEQKEIKVLNS